MKQPIKKEIKQEYNLKDIKPRVNKSKKKEHQDYNVSKLEDRFAENFLDKLKVKYVHQFEAKDIVFESKEPVITLVGIFLTKGDLLTGIEGLMNLIKSDLIHAFNITEHNLNFNGVVADGMTVTVVQTMAKVYFKVTIVE